MSWKNSLKKSLDRPGLRPFLAAMLTRRARAQYGNATRVFFDDGWYADLGDCSVYLGQHDPYIYPSPRELAGLMEGAADHWFYVYRPKAGDVVIDVGAGKGWDTLAFARAVGPSGRVISIEANPRTFDCLARLCKVNNLANVVLINAAVLDEAGEVFIEDGPQDEGNRVVSNREGSPVDVFPVKGFTLDQICEEHHVDRIDFLKMNIEGAEAAAIRGMNASVSRTHYACIACHDFLAENDSSMRTAALVREFLDASGFRIHVRDQDPRPYVQCHLHGSREGA